MKLSPFFIAKYEVTQAQWMAVMGSNPSAFKGKSQPVETISWNDAQEFLKKLDLGFPTEARWEYACRAGTTGPDAGDLESMGWYGENSGGKAHPVGEKKANGFGLHDMHGNVFEWCEDVYDAGFYSKREAGGPDPVAITGFDRVIRGGGWGVDAWRCRSASRHWIDPGISFDGFGLRPSRPL